MASLATQLMITRLTLYQAFQVRVLNGQPFRALRQTGALPGNVSMAIWSGEGRLGAPTLSAAPRRMSSCHRQTPQSLAQNVLDTCHCERTM
jgi:hypothetical protein